VAEWNVYIDPHAAAAVLRSGAPVTLVPLDATNHARVTLDFVHRLGERRSTPAADFAYRVLEGGRDTIAAGEYYFWDPLAAGIALDESLADIEELSLTVVEDEGPLCGQIRIDPAGNPVRVCTRADGPRFESLFLERLTGFRQEGLARRGPASPL
jgi:inosine-uridine nucleoside N-ribohydrolase